MGVECGGVWSQDRPGGFSDELWRHPRLKVVLDGRRLGLSRGVFFVKLGVDGLEPGHQVVLLVVGPRGEPILPRKINLKI